MAMTTTTIEYATQVAKQGPIYVSKALLVVAIISVTIIITIIIIFLYYFHCLHSSLIYAGYVHTHVTGAGKRRR